MKANSKQSSIKSKATTTPMSLRSSQLSIQNTPKTPNETNTLKEEILAGRNFSEKKIWRIWREFNLADAERL